MRIVALAILALAFTAQPASAAEKCVAVPYTLTANSNYEVSADLEPDGLYYLYVNGQARHLGWANGTGGIRFLATLEPGDNLHIRDYETGQLAAHCKA